MIIQIIMTNEFKEMFDTFDNVLPTTNKIVFWYKDFPLLLIPHTLKMRLMIRFKTGNWGSWLQVLDLCKLFEKVIGIACSKTLWFEETGGSTMKLVNILMMDEYETFGTFFQTISPISFVFIRLISSIATVCK